MAVTFVLRNQNGRGRDWTEGEDAKVVRLRKGGLSSREIADCFDNRSAASLKNRVRKLQQRGAM